MLIKTNLLAGTTYFMISKHELLLFIYSIKFNGIRL